MPPDEADRTRHFRALESLYAAAPINRLFESRLEIVAAGEAQIRTLCHDRSEERRGTVLA